MPRKKNNKKIAPHENTINISLVEHMSAEELQHIIAKAIIEADEIKKQKKAEQKQNEKMEWKKSLGYRDHSTDKTNAVYKRILQKCNTIKMRYRLLFIPENKVKGDRATASLIKGVVSSIFWLIKWVFNVLTGFLLLLILHQYILRTSTQLLPWYSCFVIFPSTYLFFVFSRIFRMARIEVEKMENRNDLFGVFASITSTISIIIAVVTIIWGG